MPSAGILALELLRHSRIKPQTGSVDFPPSEFIQKLSNLVSWINFIFQPTNGNYGICGQVKKMLQSILDAVLSTERDQPAVDENKQASKTLDTFMVEGMDDQTWLNTNLDMDFWTSLEDYPLLAWPDATKNL